MSSAESKEHNFHNCNNTTMTMKGSGGGVGAVDVDNTNKHRVYIPNGKQHRQNDDTESTEYLNFTFWIVSLTASTHQTQ